MAAAEDEEPRGYPAASAAWQVLGWRLEFWELLPPAAAGAARRGFVRASAPLARRGAEQWASYAAVRVEEVPGQAWKVGGPVWFAKPEPGLPEAEAGQPV